MFFFLTKLMSYDFEVVYCNDNENKAVDALSQITGNSNIGSQYLGA